jgi:hypothetical protein
LFRIQNSFWNRKYFGLLIGVTEFTIGPSIAKGNEEKDWNGAISSGVHAVATLFLCTLKF